MTSKDGVAAAHDRWRRRQATILIGQLPEDHDDAVAILDYARGIVLDFIAERGQERPAGVQLTIVGNF